MNTIISNSKGLSFVEKIIQKKEEFHAYYDVLFSHKDYSSEIDYLLNSWTKFNRGHCTNIIDLGCGTGGHSIEFASRGKNILGLDIDNNMIEIAKQKSGSSNTKFVSVDVLNLSTTQKWDLVYAYFFVVNYILQKEYFIKLASKVFSLLRNGGGFYFDVVNGLATLHDPPRVKHILVNKGDMKLMEKCCRVLIVQPISRNIIIF